MTFFALGLAALLAVISASTERGLPRVYRLRDEQKKAEARNARLAAENLRLIARVRALNDDAEVIASVARDQLGLLRPGEIVVRFEVTP